MISSSDHDDDDNDDLLIVVVVALLVVMIMSFLLFWCKGPLTESGALCHHYLLPRTTTVHNTLCMLHDSIDDSFWQGVQPIYQLSFLRKSIFSKYIFYRVNSRQSLKHSSLYCEIKSAYKKIHRNKGCNRNWPNC